MMILNRFFIIAFFLVTCAQAFANKDKNNVHLLVPTSIFKPLIADPKWPRFSIAYIQYTNGQFKYKTMAPNFGAALPLVRWEGKERAEKEKTTYEFGLHAGLFATMDIQSSPTRLINADYFIGPNFVITSSPWDALFRFSHTSSHLGDELILSADGQKRNIKRINLSYEMVEAILCYNLPGGLRPYAGVGYIVHAEPENYKTAEYIAGLDYRHPEYYLQGYAKPIAGVYSKVSKNYHWKPSLSIKAGVEFKDKFVIGKKLQLLLEYYNGNSFHGQFYNSREKYVGISLNLNF